TIAHNIAWSIAERQQRPAALVDLDLPFGAAAMSFRQPNQRSIGEAFAAAAPDDAMFDDVAIQHTPRLKLFAAPASLDADSKIDTEALDHVLAKVRRTSAHVVLDLPHVWSAWTQQTLLAADDIIIVAGPDLASLSSAKNMVEALREARPGVTPHIVLSMTG